METFIGSLLQVSSSVGSGPLLLTEMAVGGPLIRGGVHDESLRLALQEPRFKGQAAVINAHLEARRGCPGW